MTDARDLLAEIDATLKLGRERHLDFREQAYDLLVALRFMVEREEAALTLLSRLLNEADDTDWDYDWSRGKHDTLIAECRKALENAP